MNSEYQTRLRYWVTVLKTEFYEPLGEIAWEAYQTKEHLSATEVINKTFAPVSPGFCWGESWEYCWFKSSIVLPEAATGKQIVLNLVPGGESTIFVNGQSFGTYRSEQCNPINEKHHFLVDNVLTTDGIKGETFELLMETYAGHYYPEPYAGCTYGPYIEGLYPNPLKEGERRTLGSCTYGIWHEEAYQLYMDVCTLGKILETTDRTSLRAVKIAEALEKFTRIVDFEQEKGKRQASYREARAMLKPLLEAENGSTMPTIYAIGNAHIDLAWMWPFEETHRKTTRTFSAQLRMMERYPEYKFIQSQPAAYEMCRQHYPELFERIKEAIKGGQWIADGAMWVEPDTNMAGGEALIRQLLYGKEYYKKEFGIDSQVLWLPDTFGYTAALPQILKGCDVKYLVTQKIFWSYNQGEKFPYHYFKWQGMDGTEVVSFLPTSYVYKTDPGTTNSVWKNRSQERDLEAFLLPFGYGDGGGGPCRDHLEYAERQRNLEGSLPMKMAGPMEFFQDMEEKGGPKNTYVGELYFSAHRGTYTTQALMKKHNRKGEFAMRELEFWSAFASLYGMTYPKEKIEELWKVVLLHQFHDILPGTCIERVYEETEKAFTEIYQQADEMLGKAFRTLLSDESNAITVFNSLSFERRCMVTLPERFQTGVTLSDGTYLPVEKTSNGYEAIVTLPACGAITLRPASETKKAERTLATITRVDGGYVMENKHIRTLVNWRGEIVSFILKESGREFATESMNTLHMYKDVPRLFDAWDIDSHYIDQEMEGAVNITVEEVQQGIEAVLKVRGTIHESSYIQYIRLQEEGKRLEFETEIDWRETHKLLKVAFPVDVYAENAINEMQFGYVERPAHRSRAFEKDRYEVCNHRYSAFCDGAHGAAVLNDCKYGISMNQNRLELTLLRAAMSPVLRSDNGINKFTYAFTAWEGPFAQCDVVRQGYEMNVKPIIMDGALDVSFIHIDQPNIVLDTVKVAEDGSGDIILRLYESKKSAVTSNVYVNANFEKAYYCDMLENELEEVQEGNEGLSVPFRAFEIKTIRLKNDK